MEEDRGRLEIEPELETDENDKRASETEAAARDVTCPFKCFTCVWGINCVCNWVCVAVAHSSASVNNKTNKIKVSGDPKSAVTRVCVHASSPRKPRHIRMSHAGSASRTRPSAGPAPMVQDDVRRCNVTSGLPQQYREASRIRGLILLPNYNQLII